MTPTLHLSLRKLLWVLVCVMCLVPTLSQALDGDDWVLVQRFHQQLKQAQAGNPAAMYNIGQMYELGRGTEPNPDLAVQWYKRAIQKGQNDARAHLGAMYFDGSGVKRNLHEALKLLKPAAKQDSPTAQYYLGRMYEQGKGVRRNIPQAIYWYKQAANNGYYLAADRLKALQNRPQAPQTTPAPQASNTTQAKSPAQQLLRIILQTKWQDNGRPSGFLPSAVTKCRERPNLVISCKSGELQRNIGNAIVSYTTDASLSGFNNAETFQGTYTYTVLKVKVVAKKSPDGKTLKPQHPPNIELGKQLLTHTLSCALQSVNRLVCTKDSNITNTYTGK